MAAVTSAKTVSNSLSNSATSSNLIYNGSNATWTVGSPVTATSGYVTLDDLSLNSYTYSNMPDAGVFTQLLQVLKEDEITELFDKIIAKSTKVDNYKNIISTAVKCRHFSEEFLLKYIDYLNVNDIMIKHSENINSSEYATLVLILTQKE